jgi:uncharacterized membrane protein (UPF0127 family)
MFQSRLALKQLRLSIDVLLRVGFAMAMSLFSNGCGEAAKVSSVESPEVTLTMPQPHLQTMKLWVGPEELNVELALTAQQQQIGMMMRTNLAEGDGMFFPLAVTQRASFWMKNCPLPLSAAYIDPEGVIIEIHSLQPFNTNAVVAGSSNIRFVLETSKGWFERHNVKTGMLIRTESGSLMDTFFRRSR